MQISLLIVDEIWKIKENTYLEMHNEHNGQWQTKRNK